MQIIFHIDMNAFFASCELNEHPEYRNKPLIVAHNSRRGIVTTASYEARKYAYIFSPRKMPKAYYCRTAF